MKPKGTVAILALLLAASAPSPLSGEDQGLLLSGSTEAFFSIWEDRGSPLVPAGSRPPHSGTARMDLRAEAGALTRGALEASLALDAMSASLSFDLRELWAEWRPGGFLALRAGRQRLGFGAGFGWNPCNDLDQARNPTDTSLPRRGVDAFHARGDATGLVGFPLSLFLAAVAPPPGEALAEGRLGTQLYAFAGEVEIMLAASLSDPAGESKEWLGGGWLTLPLGPLVLGLEAAARSRADLFRPGALGTPLQDRSARGQATATATVRAGDFILIAEAFWNDAAYSRAELASILASPAYLPAYAATLSLPGSVGAFHGLLRLAWASGDWSAAATALIDLETGAYTCTLRMESALQGRAGLALELSIPAPKSLLADDELGLGGKGWAAKATVTAYF